jgi:ribosome-associated protein
MLRINARLSIDERNLQERFIAATGPGGQNVNKVATAVELRFDASHAAALTEAVRLRLTRLAGRRMTQDGVLVIQAQRFRTQERNRADARARLVALLQEAAAPPAPRFATRPTLASKRRRLDGKAARAVVKRARERPEAE